MCDMYKKLIGVFAHPAWHSTLDKKVISYPRPAPSSHTLHHIMPLETLSITICHHFDCFALLKLH